ncbi:MAG: EAL domain-containing protein [Spirochaetia bacterium]|nr:EAL domain-containing protein [Spirochaetia bacterium]
MSLKYIFGTAGIIYLIVLPGISKALNISNLTLLILSIAPLPAILIFLFSVFQKNSPKKQKFIFNETSPSSLQGNYAETLYFTQAINEMIMNISESDSVDFILSQMTHILGRTLQADRALIYDIDFGKNVAEGMCEWLNLDIPEITPSIGTYPLDLFREGCSHILKTRNYLESHISNINPILQKDGSAELLHNTMQIKSLLWLPFYFSKDSFYLLVFNQVSHERNWSGSEMEFLVSAARQITVAIQKIILLRDLYHEKEQALVTLKSIGDAVITTNTEGTIQFINPIAEKLTGYSKEEAVNRSLSDIFTIKNEINGETLESPLEKCLREGKIIALSNHTVLRQKNGNEIPIEDSAAPIKNNTGEIIGAVLVFHDVLDARKLKNQLEWQASHDPLTELYNRREFEKRLSDIISEESRTGTSHCMLYLDLDQFKIVNDTCGHSAGDELLRQISPILQDAISENDFLARLGGDEFGILLINSDIERARLYTDKIIKAINNFRYLVNDRIFEIGASIGIVNITDLDKSISSIMSNADLACYAAKDLGRNRYYVFEINDSDMAKKHKEMEWVSRINSAFENNFFRLYTQKIIPVSGQNGFQEHHEVLLRLSENNEKIITPGAFLSAAERYHLIQDIDKWVIDASFNYLSGFLDKNKSKKISLSINLSGMSVSDEYLLDFIYDRMKFYKTPPESVCFEITETAAIANLGRVHKLMLELKSAGFRFALDDFGSGLSSFAYLKHLPVDYLKIDGNFVSELLESPVDRAMVESINQIGHVMNLKTIAEFVVKEEILNQLKNIGVDYAQGFAISKPQPIENLNHSHNTEL